jgi:hypothetical protein
VGTHPLVDDPSCTVLVYMAALLALVAVARGCKTSERPQPRHLTFWLAMALIGRVFAGVLLLNLFFRRMSRPQCARCSRTRPEDVTFMWSTFIWSSQVWVAQHATIPLTLHVNE